MAKSKNTTIYSPIIEEGNRIFRLIENRIAHLDQPNSIQDEESSKTLIRELDRLILQIPEISNPKNLDDFLQAELKRRATAQKAAFVNQVSMDTPGLEEIISVYCIPSEDLDDIEIWLKENRSSVLMANKRLSTHNLHRKDPISTFLGSTIIRESVEKIVNKHINNLKSILKKYYINRPGVKTLLKQYLITTDSLAERSYANWLNYVVLIAIKSVSYMYLGQVSVTPEKLVSVFGHEVIGHALNSHSSQIR